MFTVWKIGNFFKIGNFEVQEPHKLIVLLILVIIISRNLDRKVFMGNSLPFFFFSLTKIRIVLAYRHLNLLNELWIEDQ